MTATKRYDALGQLLHKSTFACICTYFPLEFPTSESGWTCSIQWALRCFFLTFHSDVQRRGLSFSLRGSLICSGQRFCVQRLPFSYVYTHIFLGVCTAFFCFSYSCLRKLFFNVFHTPFLISSSEMWGLGGLGGGVGTWWRSFHEYTWSMLEKVWCDSASAQVLEFVAHCQCIRVWNVNERYKNLSRIQLPGRSRVCKCLQLQGGTLTPN